LQEELLLHSIEKRLMFPNIAFYEIPESERRPEIPQRIRVGLSPDLEAKWAERQRARPD
jgi:hypothetical protein